MTTTFSLPHYIHSNGALETALAGKKEEGERARARVVYTHSVWYIERERERGKKEERRRNHGSTQTKCKSEYESWTCV